MMLVPIDNVRRRDPLTVGLIAGFLTGLVIVLLMMVAAPVNAQSGGEGTPHLECEVEDGAVECELRGRIAALESTAAGTELTIAQRPFLVTDATDVDTTAGPLAVDACVEVTYWRDSSSPHPASKIDVESPDDCRNHGGPGDDGPGDDDPGDDEPGDDRDDDEFRGRLVTLSASEIVVENTRDGQRLFQITTATAIDDDYGAPDVGDCVEVEFDDVTDPPTALEIERKRDYNCGGGADDDPGEPGDDDRDGEGRLYGVLESVSPVPGTWVISAISFEVTAATEFREHENGFDVGDMVKVEFYVMIDPADGANRFVATEIEEKYGRDDDGRDHDGNGVYEGVEGKAYGPIDAYAAQSWTVGGITFVVDEATDAEITPEINRFVEVKFFLNAAGERQALRIEAADNDDDGDLELVGFVTDQPGQGFLGEWAIANVPFTANAQTEFDETRGLLAVGVFVEAHYTIAEDGGKLLYDLEVHVPPGAGDRDRIGRLEQRGSGGAGANSDPGERWVIEGRTYLINAATRLNDRNGPLDEGANVIVNSYAAVDGAEVATSVSGFQQDSSLFLPLIVGQ